ncbi:MAG: hypothetical protein ACXABY_35645 [Candidatus Thorarchaeota archaeon]
MPLRSTVVTDSAKSSLITGSVGGIIAGKRFRPTRGMGHNRRKIYGGVDIMGNAIVVVYQEKD